MCVRERRRQCGRASVQQVGARHEGGGVGAAPSVVSREVDRAPQLAAAAGSANECGGRAPGGRPPPAHMRVAGAQAGHRAGIGRRAARRALGGGERPSEQAAVAQRRRRRAVPPRTIRRPAEGADAAAQRARPRGRLGAARVRSGDEAIPGAAAPQAQRLQPSGGGAAARGGDAAPREVGVGPDRKEATAQRARVAGGGGGSDESVLEASERSTRGATTRVPRFAAAARAARRPPPRATAAHRRWPRAPPHASPPPPTAAAPPAARGRCDPPRRGRLTAPSPARGSSVGGRAPF